MINSIMERFRKIHLYSKFNWVVLIATLIVGAAMWAVDGIIYRTLDGTIPGPILIALLFGLLYVVLAIVVFLCSKICRAFEMNLITWRRNDGGGVMIILGIGLAIVLCVSALFELLYELDFGKKTSEPTSYVFVIDDSGTMSTNDPQQQRFAAIQTVLQNQSTDFPFMVYTFTSECQIARDMAPVSAGVPTLTGGSDGGTDIGGALRTVLKDYENGTWDGGDMPKVILLTDGQDDVFFLKGLLRNFAKYNISISTIGLGEGVDADILQQIADGTGGVFMMVEDAGDLSTAMQSATTTLADRDLISKRVLSGNNVLYGILRVLFLTIIGSLIGILMTYAYGNQDTYMPNNITAVVTALAGALLMEIGNRVGLPEWIMRLVMWVLFALTIGMIDRDRDRYEEDDGRSDRVYAGSEETTADGNYRLY